MAAQLVLHLPVVSRQHERPSLGSHRLLLFNRPSEENLLSACRFAPAFLDARPYVEQNLRCGLGYSTSCHAKRQQRDGLDAFGKISCALHDAEFCQIGQDRLPDTSRQADLHVPNNGRNGNRMVCYAKKERVDFFDWGKDPRMINGRRFVEEGLQDPEPLSFPVDPESKHGFLDFPAKYNIELASLPILARKDVRKCCCFVAGGVYENLLFFPVIKLLKERYPGVEIDVVATARGKQAYEINKYIKRAWVYDVDAQFVVPSEYLEFVGKIKNEYYEMLVSTRLSGIGHSLTLWLTSSRDKIAYVFPDVNAAGAGLFLSNYAVAPRLNLADGGYHMYTELIEVLKNPQPKVPEMVVKPLEVAISKRVKNFTQQKYMQEELSPGEFMVFHGIESISKASMQSKGDSDSLLPLQIWAEIAKAASTKWVIVVPYEPDKRQVLQVLGEEGKVVFITTPGQLAAIINDSIGVVTTNTAAVQIACAMKKPSVALFSSAEKASLFVPHASERRCTVVSSGTGKLVDIDVQAAIEAMKSIEAQVLVAA